MKKKSTTKKRNPQDATLRNIRALKRRVEALEGKVDWLVQVIHWLMGTGIVHHTGTYGFPEYKEGRK